MSVSRRLLLGLCLGLCLVCGAAWAQHLSPDDPAAALTPNPAPAVVRSLTVVLDDNYPPYIFRDSAGKVQGILVDTWALWQARTGVKVNLQAMDWSAALQAMASGHADVIDTIFKTPAREQVYDFSKPYAQLAVPIFFHHSIGGIVDAGSVRGFTVGVKDGDACIDVLQTHGVGSFKTFASYSDVVAAAQTNEVRVFCMDEPPAAYLLNQHDMAKDFRQTQAIYSGQFHRAVRKDQIALLQHMEAGFGLITAAEYKQINDKWRGSEVHGVVHVLLGQYAGTAALVVVVLTLTLVLWNMVLRRLVLEKTASLTQSVAALEQARLDAEHTLARLKLVASRVPGVVYQFLLRPDGSACFPFASDAINDVYRVSPQQVLHDASAVMAVLHPDDLDQINASIAQSAKQLTPWQHEYRVRFADGTVRWLFGNALPERHPDGAVLWHGFITDITERRAADQALKASLQDKVALLNEVHHRVKNNLQVITSLLRLEANRSTEPVTKNVLNDMQGRIHAMALLHESLYRTGTFASVSLGGYVRQLANQVFRVQGQSGAVRLALDMADVQVGMDQATPCGLMVNELISNSLKHGFPPGHHGEVRVTLRPTDQPNQWALTVSDTGVGLPADFDARRSHSLGMQLVSDLARQMGGSLSTGPGPGAAFTVVFAVQVFS